MVVEELNYFLGFHYLLLFSVKILPWLGINSLLVGVFKDNFEIFLPLSAMWLPNIADFEFSLYLMFKFFPIIVKFVYYHYMVFL